MCRVCLAALSGVLTIVLLLVLNGTVECAEPVIELPADSGYVDIRQKYGARGDGVTDDTTAFEKALSDRANQLFLPAGTYLVRDIITFGDDFVIQGAGRSQTIIKLQDQAAGFDGVDQPKPLVYVTDLSRDRNSNKNGAFHLSHLTIDIGRGNPGAIGLHYMVNRQGYINRVIVRSSDREFHGKVGVLLASGSPGQIMFKEGIVEGFDTAIQCTGIPNLLFSGDGISLRNQRDVGIDNLNQVVVLRKIVSHGATPLLRNRGDGAFATLLDVQSTGGAGGTLIESTDNAALHVRNLQSVGFKKVIDCRVRDKSVQFLEPTVSEFASHSPLAVFDTSATVNLPVEETPELPWPPPHEWINVASFGARPKLGPADTFDAGPSIQRAIDSGARSIYFPRGIYPIRTPIVVRGQVERLFGCESRLWLLTADKPAFLIGDGDAAAVHIERFGADDVGSSTRTTFQHATRRTLVIRDSTLGGYENTVAGGRVFLENVIGANWTFTGQQVWARQFNTVTKENQFNVRVVDSQLWLFGMKTDGKNSALVANGGRVELFGGFFYAPRAAVSGEALIDLTDSRFSGGWIGSARSAARPQVGERMLGKAGSLTFYEDLTDPKDAGFVFRLFRDDTVVTETMERRTNRSPHGGYRRAPDCVKIPIFQGGVPQ